MAEQGPYVPTQQEASDADGSEGIDLERIREMAGFVVRSTRRRPKLVAGTFVLVATLGVTVAVTMPKTYTSEVKLLAQRTSAMRALSGNQNMDEDPLKNVGAMILRRDNIVGLVKEANLVQRFDETRPRALRFKDHVMQWVYGPPSEDAKLMAMVFSLEKRLEVTSEGADLTISVDWPNARIAFDLVTMVQRNFLEAKYDSEVSVIKDSLALLEERAKNELTHVDEELAEYQKKLGEHSATVAISTAQEKARERGVFAPRMGIGGTGAAGAPMPAWLPDPEVTKALEDKRLQIRSLEESHRQTLEAVKQQLAQLQLTLTPMHPSVVTLQQRVDAMSQPPPELAQLRSEERALMAQIAAPRPAASTSASPPALGVPPAFRAPYAPMAAPSGAPDAGADAGETALPFPPSDRDGSLWLAESKLSAAIHAYEDVMGRIDTARVELDINKAAYKYKYTVVTPAELPDSPQKSKARVVAIGSVVGAALLALLLATGLDLLGGSILETWQIRRRLKLDVLGELDRPS
jgi:uncharacterized protein involved in exopolysaccharide biosynthesis